MNSPAARNVAAVAVFAMALVTFAWVRAAVGVEGAADAAALQSDLGVTLAMAGRVAEAESAFVSVLSLSPRDPRALNNLGNLSLMRGDAEVALAFYGRAALQDTADAGIVLNRAVARLLGGDADGARAEAAAALAKTGGTEQARSLLGIRAARPGISSAKGTGDAVLTPEQITALLESAKASVPSDTLAVSPGDSLAAEETPERGPAWRSAGPRAARLAGIATLLYWRR